MTTSDRSLKETYREYVAGHVSFDAVKRATDRAADAYQRSRARTADPAPLVPRREDD